MKFITLITALAVAIPAALAALTINTPTNVVVCQPTQFSWSGGTAPYYLSLTPAGQTSVAPYKQFDAQNGTSLTWTCDLGAGTSFTIVLKDSTGTSAFSDIVTVQGGTDNSCVNTTSVSETGSGGSAASTASGSSASSGSATSTASSSSSTQSSAAGHLSVSSAFGVAGIIGLVGAALF